MVVMLVCFSDTEVATLEIGGQLCVQVASDLIEQPIGMVCSGKMPSTSDKVVDATVCMVADHKWPVGAMT
jgi:hypothetical protein